MNLSISRDGLKPSFGFEQMRQLKLVIEKGLWGREEVDFGGVLEK